MVAGWAPLPGRPSKRGIAGSTLVDRLRDHDRKRWDRRRMGDFKPGTEETPDASAYPAQVSHFSAERRHPVSLPCDPKATFASQSRSCPQISEPF
jgi:hypothetical protein